MIDQYTVYWVVEFISRVSGYVEALTAWTNSLSLYKLNYTLRRFPHRGRLVSVLILILFIDVVCLSMFLYFQKYDQMFFIILGSVYFEFSRERSGSVIECLTRDRGAAGSSLTGVTALCPWARHINASLVLVQPRKTHPYITETLLMGRKESNYFIWYIHHFNGRLNLIDNMCHIYILIPC